MQYLFAILEGGNKYDILLVLTQFRSFLVKLICSKYRIGLKKNSMQKARQKGT